MKKTKVNVCLEDRFVRTEPDVQHTSKTYWCKFFCLATQHFIQSSDLIYTSFIWGNFPQSELPPFTFISPVQNLPWINYISDSQFNQMLVKPPNNKPPHFSIKYWTWRWISIFINSIQSHVILVNIVEILFQLPHLYTCTNSCQDFKQYFMLKCEDGVDFLTVYKSSQFSIRMWSSF